VYSSSTGIKAIKFLYILLIDFKGLATKENLQSTSELLDSYEGLGFGSEKAADAKASDIVPQAPKVPVTP
jgi:hypothetical protein